MTTPNNPSQLFRLMNAIRISVPREVADDIEKQIESLLAHREQQGRIEELKDLQKMVNHNAPKEENDHYSRDSEEYNQAQRDAIGVVDLMIIGRLSTLTKGDNG